jgi:formylglycine-generating enzyme required for sulfatase activity
MLLIEETNKYSEQSLFYEGYFDAWKQKDNKQNAIYFQTYIVPPNSIPLFKRVYMDATEVANIHYQEFLHFVERDSGQKIHDMYLPVLDENYTNNYFNNPEFYFFPVVGINYESAKTYCDWRAKNLNEGLKLFLANESKYAKYKYVGRLPTEHEWRRAAGKIATHATSKTHDISKKGQEFLKSDIVKNGFAKDTFPLPTKFEAFNVNLKHADSAFKMSIPYYIYGFEPKSTGFYNLYGNVKEIVNEGYGIGGSFKTGSSHHDLYEKTTTFDYQTDIGFRCVNKVVR